MNLSPSQLAEYTPIQFDIKCKGFDNAFNKLRGLFRQHLWLSVLPHVDQKAGLTIDKLWPLKPASAEPLFTKDKIDKWAEIMAARKARKENAVLN